MKRGILLMLLIGLMAGMSQAAVVTFYDNKGDFDAASTTSMIDFESIVPATAANPWVHPAHTGVSFSASFGNVDIYDSTVPFYGSSVYSDLLYADNLGASLTVTLPAGTTAVGGFFGKLVATEKAENTQMTLVVNGETAPLYDEAKNVSAMNTGTTTVPNFFGWIVSGDTIASITHSLVPPSVGFIDGEWAGIDNFQYGQGDTDIIPEPASCIVWSLIGLSCIGAGWWRRRKAA